MDDVNDDDVQPVNAGEKTNLGLLDGPAALGLNRRPVAVPRGPTTVRGCLLAAARKAALGAPGRVASIKPQSKLTPRKLIPPPETANAGDGDNAGDGAKAGAQ